MRAACLSYAVAVPATVSGERDAHRFFPMRKGQPLGRTLNPARPGKAVHRAMTREPGDLPTSGRSRFGPGDGRGTDLSGRATSRAAGAASVYGPGAGVRRVRVPPRVRGRPWPDVARRRTGLFHVPLSFRPHRSPGLCSFVPFRCIPAGSGVRRRCAAAGQHRHRRHRIAYRSAGEGYDRQPGLDYPEGSGAPSDLSALTAVRKHSRPCGHHPLGRGKGQPVSHSGL